MPTELNSPSSTAAASARTTATGPKEVTRHIKPDVTAMLWGRAAGRCEFWGCNTQLWKSAVTQESVNHAQRAHIYSFSDDGPRGNVGIDKGGLNDIGNLMLVCYGCHRTIDKHKDGGRYPADLLRRWKAEHERRIEIVTGINPRKSSQVVVYGANVGDHSSPLNFTEAAQAMFPSVYPAEDRAIELGTINSSFDDRSERFWDIEAENLKAQFARRVRERISAGEINHVSLFALAPQPLLILLGTLMIDITNAEVFQRHREPQTWCWPDIAGEITFRVEEPADTNGIPVLVLALTASVTDDRITGVVGSAVSIWRVTVDNPHNDLIKSREHLAAFRSVVRPLLDRIKACHGQSTPLHVFPVMGIAPAIEFGRVRMPKAHMPWKIYDQVNARGGFIPALTISSGTTS
ncbi:HNH endonuclease [Symmachiella dynata]|uniref:HNH endonuclease n=1 Tax=Symmachiella dynata TaxID=2527995 RepID=UPI0030EEE1E9